MSITAKNLSFQYETGTPFVIDALQDINFTIKRGEFVGIMGHTGCGKSTLFQIICGLINPTNGTVLIDNEDIFKHHQSYKRHKYDYDRKSLRKKLGIVFQYPENQLFETTVEKDVAYGLKHINMPASEINNRVQWALELMGFSYKTIRHISPLSLSGGEKRRVAIAGILAIRPDYLLLDEPIAGLDPVMRNHFMKLLQKLNQDGMTILMISHNADCISEYTKRLLILEKGHLIADGTTCHLFSDIDWMESHQLGISQSKLIACKLQKHGWNIPKNTTTYKELLYSLQTVIKSSSK